MAENTAWHGKIALAPTEGLINVPVLTFGVDGSLFGERAPKSKNLKVVKLTKDNVHEVGKYIANHLKTRMSVDPDGALKVGTFAAYPDSWIVEEYDYLNDRVKFRTATIDDREKYDLR